MGAAMDRRVDVPIAMAGPRAATVAETAARPPKPVPTASRKSRNVSLPRGRSGPVAIGRDVAAEGAAGARARSRDRRASAPRTGAFPDGFPERVDRALRVYAERPFRCLRGVGPHRIDPRTARADGGLASPRAHGVQGDAGPHGE